MYRTFNSLNFVLLIAPLVERLHLAETIADIHVSLVRIDCFRKFLHARLHAFHYGVSLAIERSGIVSVSTASLAN